MIDENVRYSGTHEWARLEDGVVTVGLSAYAIEQLGDNVYVELPAVGDEVRKDAAFGEIESVKAAPVTTPVGRLDETAAARNLDIASL